MERSYERPDSPQGEMEIINNLVILTINRVNQILPLWKRMWSFIWTNFSPPHPRMLCVKFGWNNLSVLYPWSREVFSPYDLYCHAPAQEPLPLGVMKFTVLVDPSLVIITIYLLCMDHAQEERRRFFLEIHQFYTFYPKIASPWSGGGDEIYNSLSPYPTDATSKTGQD